MYKREKENENMSFSPSYFVMSFFFFAVNMHCLSIDIMSFPLIYYTSRHISKININIFLFLKYLLYGIIYRNPSTVPTNTDLMLTFELCFKLYEAIQETEAKCESS